VLKHTKSELTKTISKLLPKIGNLGLKIDVKSAHRAILGCVIRKPPKLVTKMGFSKLGGRNAIQK
jgi:hypothetical protein